MRRRAGWCLPSTDLPAGSADQTIERRGPRVDAPAKARDGFLKSLGTTDVELGEIEDKKGRFLTATFVEKGRPTAAVLAEALPEILAQFPWPKSMRWADGEARWVRPLQAILCLFDGEVVPFTLRRDQQRQPDLRASLHGARRDRGRRSRRLHGQASPGAGRARCGGPTRGDRDGSDAARHVRRLPVAVGPGAARRDRGPGRMAGAADRSDRRCVHDASRPRCWSRPCGRTRNTWRWRRPRVRSRPTS